MDDLIQNGADQFNDPENDLGQEISHHRLRNLSFKRWGSVIFGGVTILTSLIIFLIYLNKTFTMFNNFGLGILLKQVPILILTLSIGLVIGVPAIIIARIKWHDGITIFENGMLVQKSNQISHWLWDDVTRLDSEIKSVAFTGGDVSKKYFVILESDQKQELFINNNYESMDRLIIQIRSSVLPLLYDQTCQNFINQESIKFHKNLKANEKGLTIKGHLFPYSDFNQPHTTNRHLELSLKSDTKKFLFKLIQIANLDLLRHLLSYPPNTIP